MFVECLVVSDPRERLNNMVAAIREVKLEMKEGSGGLLRDSVLAHESLSHLSKVTISLSLIYKIRIMGSTSRVYCES